MAPSFIVGRQVVVQIVGPGGKVDVGKYEEVTITVDVETDDYDAADGNQYQAIVGPRVSGTLKRGKLDGGVASMVMSHANPGTADPPRFVVIYTDTGGDVHTLTDVTLKKWGISVGKGIVKEDLDFKAVGIS